MVYCRAKTMDHIVVTKLQIIERKADYKWISVIADEIQLLTETKIVVTTCALQDIILAQVPALHVNMLF